MRIQFNTGRGYSATGQPITAVYNYSNVVMFRDHARGIYGHRRDGTPVDVNAVIGEIKI